MCVRDVRLLLVVLVGCLLAPAAAHGAAFAPERGEVFHSGSGGYDAGAIDDFAAQSGKHPAVFQYFVSWRSGASDVSFLKRLLQSSNRARSRAALAVSTKWTSPALVDTCPLGGWPDQLININSWSSACGCTCRSPPRSAWVAGRALRIRVGRGCRWSSAGACGCRRPRSTRRSRCAPRRACETAVSR